MGEEFDSTGVSQQETLSTDADVITVIEGKLAEMREEYPVDSYTYRVDIPLSAQYVRKTGDRLREYMADPAMVRLLFPKGSEYAMMGELPVIATYDRGLAETFLKTMGVEERFATMQAIESQAEKTPLPGPSLGSAFRPPDSGKEWHLQQDVQTTVDGVALHISRERKDYPLSQRGGYYYIDLRFSKSAAERVAKSTPTPPKLPAPQYL